MGRRADCVGPSIFVSDASPASSDFLTEGVAYFGRVANCASDEMIGRATAFAFGAIEGSDGT
jgi:hypothetical protein